MGIELLPKQIIDTYEVHEWKHESAILKGDFPNEWDDLVNLLVNFKLCKSWVFEGGGRKSKVATAIDKFLYNKQWVEKKFETSVKADQFILESPTHKVDCFKNRVTIEIEWNNKDPFFDRDLNNFRLLLIFVSSVLE